MSDGGFLGASQPEQMPQPVAPEAPETTAPQESAELDEVALAERQALSDMEVAAEQEQEKRFLETAAEAAPTTQVAPVQTATAEAEAPLPVQKDEVTIAVERILEEGLEEHFKNMPPDAKERFQKKGVEVAGRISAMVRSFKVKAKNVIILIRQWLLTIPGVNKFFMEQEAKIKTDRILTYEQELKNKSQGGV